MKRVMVDAYLYAYKHENNIRKCGQDGKRSSIERPLMSIDQLVQHMLLFPGHQEVDQCGVPLNCSQKQSAQK